MQAIMRLRGAGEDGLLVFEAADVFKEAGAVVESHLAASAMRARRIGFKGN
ncbi:hypothetical protein SH580_18475 [Coraliomargarita algicola]|uniref:Uncharacterized protein n=1 Tax=Coraliomargarita algicola TaxID=3092156 RepID=A0ABZ0RJH4_9BACT|nr:hypothetical protein [Coraliomargarita sp. J2-16]WPJ95409.1 hypothetical protein SH580_18475 [Coraliomargarita sp. J2-16]